MRRSYPTAVLWGAAAVALLIALLLIFARSRGALMRSIALALFVFALANPSITREDRDPLTSVAVVVVDKSPSQEFGDRTAQTEAARAQVAERLGRIPNLEVRFVEAGQADGETDGTRLFTALTAALADVPQDRVAGAILITDGRVHDVPTDAAALGFSAPVHGLITGHANERDRRVVLVTDAALRHRRPVADHHLQDRGSGRVARHRADHHPPRRRADRQPQRAGRAERQRQRARSPHAGPNIVEIEASPIDNELTEVNNRAVVSIDGVRDKLRVLLVSGEPHAGERTWRNLLKSDASVDLVHFTILRPPEKQDGTPINELSLIAFPTRELFQQKINEFQLIIFDRYARQGVLPLIYFDNIARYVRDGGAVLVAAGPDYASQTSLWRTPLEVILPAEPNGRTTDGAFRAALTELGKRHPVTRGLEGADSDPPHWSQLVPPGRHPHPQGHRGDARSRRQAAAGAVARGRRPRRAAALRPHLAVGARLRGRRPAHRPAAAAVALADEAARPRGRGAAHVRARPRPHRAAPDHGGRRSSDITLTMPSGKTRDLKLTEAEPGVWRAAIEANELGLWRATDGTLTALANVGPANPREFTEVTSTLQPLAPLASATGGDVVRIEDGSGVSLPRIVGTRSSDTFHGDNWIGLRIREASVVRGIGVLPVFAGLIGLLLLVGALAATWAREGR